MGKTPSKFPAEVQAHAVRMDLGHGRGRVPPPDLRRELVLVVLPTLTFLNPKNAPRAPLAIFWWADSRRCPEPSVAIGPLALNVTCVFECPLSVPMGSKWRIEY